jgi:hypothetical protein
MFMKNHECSLAGRKVQSKISRSVAIGLFGVLELL